MCVLDFAEIIYIYIYPLRNRLDRAPDRPLQGATDSDRGRCEQMDGRREKRRRELKDKAWRLGEDPDAWCWYGHVGHVMWTASEILLLDLQLQPQHR